jgi:hypothetical protein
VTHKIVIAALLVVIAITGILLASRNGNGIPTYRAPASRSLELLIPPQAEMLETSHYRIHYTGTTEQAEFVGAAVEKLHAAYVSVFPPSGTSASSKLTLVLYKDQAEFKQNNRSSPWAEAYYSRPACYAYFSPGTNPYHWMTHEATHQLATEVSGFRRNRWIEEGLASYFGTSTLSDAGLQLGTIDSNAYPAWWLSRFRLTGNMARDVAAEQFLPVEVLLTGKGGPAVDRNFNLYYVDAWTLTHFLMHFDNGRYASGYRQFLAQGAKAEDFVSLIGPLDRVQEEWYRYLIELQRLH